MVAFMVMALAAFGQTPGAAVTVDPVTRCFQIEYGVPQDAPELVEVLCAWSPAGAGDWRPAPVTPFVSETALNLATDGEWDGWRAGRVTERRAAGLARTVVFNPYPDAQTGGKVAADFRITVQAPDGAVLATTIVPLQADNADVVCLEDWTGVFQRDCVATGADPGPGKWWFAAAEGASLGNELRGTPEAPDRMLPQLTHPLALSGTYAIFVRTPAGYGMRMRLSGDERTDPVSSARLGREVLWQWRAMDRQHLVLRQPHGYKGYAPARLDYVRLVPLTAEQAAQLDGRFGVQDKTVAGYWEPYSWAFVEDVQDTLQHRAVLTAYRDARIPLVDTQLGRFGMKNVFETRAADQLVHATIGDPVAGDRTPTTDNVGRMQQFTNTLDATIRYTKELGLCGVANFGASNCYPGTPLQGDFSRAHPEWMRGSALRFEVPEVREYALSLYREALEQGAEAVSIDYCRYPETIDTAETANIFMAALRALADEYGGKRGVHIPILTRFPGKGVRNWENFDYARWAREGWVDYLCPSNIQGRHMHIDMAPYFEAVKGTAARLLPAVEALEWGLPFPGPFLWRVRQLYDQGAPGVYVYQADGRVLGSPEDRRTMRLLASGEGVRNWWAEDARLRPLRSKGIHISRPSDPDGRWHKYERLRIWVEGVPFGPMEVWLDDAKIGETPGMPYLAGTEDTADDGVIPPGEHILRVRVRDGDAWLEQSFPVTGG